MPANHSRIAAPRRLLLALAPLLCLAALAADARAQVATTIDSDPANAIGNRLTARNTVEGIVYEPTGQRLNRRVRVRISGATGGTLFTWTDDNGAFAFRRIAGGTYQITVDAGEGVRAVENVDVFDPGSRAGHGQTVNVHVQLRWAERRAAAKPGTVNAALADVPKAALELYQQALDAARAGDGRKAVEKLKGALKHHPRFMLAFNELGVQHMRLNELAEAEAALRSAAGIAPEDYNPRFNLGLLFLRRKQFEPSAAELRLALKSKPSAAPARMHLGRALIGLGRFAEAEAEMRQAAELGGAEVNEAHRYLGAIYIELADAARAVASLEKYLALEPKAKDADSIRKILEQLRARSAKS